MSQSQFIKLVAVAMCLVVSQGNAQAEQVGLIAQATNTCQINSLTNSGLTTVSDPPTGLTGSVSITIGCTGTGSGNLVLTLNPSVVNNGGATMQFTTTKSGVLAAASTNPTTSSLTVPITWTPSNLTGAAQIKVDIAATNSKLLKAANDYQLVVSADFN